MSLLSIMAYLISVLILIIKAQIILDVNPILSPFSDCLIQIINFKLVAFKNEARQLSDFSNNDINFLNDFAPVKYPIVLNSFLITKNEDKYGGNFKVQNSNAYAFAPKLTLYFCAIQIFLNLDLIGRSCQNDILKDQNANNRLRFPEDCLKDNLVPSDFLKILFPHIICEPSNSKDSRTMCPYDAQSYNIGQFIPPHFEKYNLYQIIIVQNFTNELEVITSYWIEELQSYLHLEAITNKPVKLIVSLEQTQYSSTSNYLFYYVHECVYEHNSYQFLGKSYNTYQTDIKLRQLVDNCILETVPTDWLIGNSNMPMFHLNNINARMKKFAKEKPITFRNFQVWMNPDIAILSELYSVSDQNDSKSSCHKPGALVYFQNEYAHLLAIEEETIQFITCGGIQTGYLSIAGYISAFDKMTWAFFLLLTFGTGSFFLVIRSLFCKIINNRGSILSDIVFPFIVFMDQDSKTARNGGRQNFLYFVSGAWILALIVLSNAYKGENITELTAPIEPQKPHFFSDLINKNFSIYCRSTGASMSYFVDGLERILDKVGSGHSRNILRTLLNYATANKVVTKLQNILAYTRNLTSDELHQESFVGIDMFVGKLESCENFAFVGWDGDIRDAELMLKSRLRKAKQMSEREVNAIVSVGKEHLFPTRRGWNLFETSIPIKYILFRMSAMYESGIAKQWKQWERWMKKIHLQNQFGRFNERITHKLGLRDNFVVVFYVELILVAICLLEFLAELLLNLIVGICFTTFVIRIPLFNSIQ